MTRYRRRPGRVGWIAAAIAIGIVFFVSPRAEAQSIRCLLFDLAPDSAYRITVAGTPQAIVSTSAQGVIAVDLTVGSGQTVRFLVVGSAPRPPSAPTGLTSAPSGPGCLQVDWNRNVEPDVVGYRLLYGPEGGTPTDSVDVGDRVSYRLCGLAEGTYTLWVRAIDATGLASPLSEPAVATVAGNGSGGTTPEVTIRPDGYWADDPARPLEVEPLPLGWTVRIYDVAGRRVRSFTNRESDGMRWTWDFRNDSGEPVPRALYLIRVFDEAGRVRGSGRFLVQRLP
jgi:hypothetical protein